MDLLSDEEVAEREELQERDELADLGYFESDDDPRYRLCQLCETAILDTGKPYCDPCEGYVRWHDEMAYEHEAAADVDEHYYCGPFS
jgi:hypothetical protein